MERKAILIVDDTPDCLELIRDIVETVDLPLDVFTATNGLDALTLARKVMPELVLMDLNMPLLDGFEATRRLKADPSTESIPVVALSAGSLPGDRERAFASGCEGYLVKPFSIDGLIRLLHQRLS